jgi:hypothetical protein
LVKHAKADFHLEESPKQDLSTVTLHQFTEAIIAGDRGGCCLLWLCRKFYPDLGEERDDGMSIKPGLRH